MMKFFIVMILAMAFFSCNEEVIEKPENLIPKEQMTEIYYDLAIIAAAKKINPIHLEKYEFETMHYIYKKYGIDSIQFVKSDIYYASIPMEYEAMYKTIEERLEEEKSVFDASKERQSDSLRKVANEQREKLRKKNNKLKEKDSIP
ncbi:MAG: DUF4296 domain-containing protein [Flavobacteriaceae bacterium]